MQLQNQSHCRFYLGSKPNRGSRVLACNTLIKFAILIYLVAGRNSKLITTTYADVSRKSSPVIGLHNCSQIYLVSNASTSGTYFQWQMRTLQNNPQTSMINNIRVPQFSQYIGSWSNKVDQLIYCTYDNITHQKYIYMLNLQTNTHYNFDKSLQLDFAAYLNQNTVLMIDAQYPYRILRGNLKLNNFQQITQYPPSLLTPLQLLKCNYDNQCFWVMKQGMIFNYPMLPLPKAVSIKDDKILQVQLVRVNDTNLMYTGTEKGLIYEWEQGESQQYSVKRILFNLAGSPIKTMHIISNSTLVGMNEESIITYIYLNQSLQTDTYKHHEAYDNLASACEFMIDKNPLVIHHGNTSAQQFFYEQYIPQVGNISDENYTTLQNVECSNKTEQIEHTAGQFAANRIFQCYFSSQIVKSNTDLSNNSYVAGCLKYIPRYQPICYLCDSRHIIGQTSKSTLNAQFKLTTCIPKLGFQNTVDSYKIDEVDISDRGKQILKFFNAIMLAAQSPFFYVKNILQLTLFSFLVHNFLSFWILTSLYYFLDFQPNFIKSILLSMWKTYNYSTFALFDIQLPKLPRLNNQQSDLDYGDVVISNDFFQFTFDPAMMLLIMFTNYFIFYYLRKWLKKKFLAKTKLKLSWLKFDLFESISDIIIQILPILFLPCANFLFNPTFTSSSQKVNFILFSGLGGFALIFPFFYFSKLVKDKKYEDSPQSKYSESIKSLIQIDNKIKKVKKKQNNFQQIQSFFTTKSKYLDSFFDCFLCLTIPILVTLNSKVPFFVINSVIITLALINTKFLKKGRLNTFLYRFYMFLFHLCFVIMEIVKEGEAFNVFGTLAIGVMIICMIHQILQFFYKVVKFIQNLIKDWKRRNIIDNKYLLREAAKKCALQKIKKQTFKQFLKTKQVENYFKEQKQQKTKNNEINIQNQLQLFRKPSKMQEKEESNFFKQNTKIQEEQILPFTPSIPSVIEKKIDRRRPRLKKQKLAKKQSILTVQSLNKQNQFEDEIYSQKQLSEDLKPIKQSKKTQLKYRKWR